MQYRIYWFNTDVIKRLDLITTWCLISSLSPLPHVISHVYRAVQVQCVSCFSIWTLYGQVAKLRGV